DRIPGKPKNRKAIQAAEKQGLSRAHRDLPEVELEPEMSERGSDQIVITDRCAAECHKKIAIRGITDCSCDDGFVVAVCSKVRRLRTPKLERIHKRWPA